MTRRVRRTRRVRKGRRRMHGSGFFGRLWEGIKGAVTKPSTWLGAAGMLPTPLAPALKLGGIVSGLAGHGRKRMRGKGIDRLRIRGPAGYVELPRLYSNFRGSGFVRF